MFIQEYNLGDNNLEYNCDMCHVIAIDYRAETPQAHS